MLCILTEVCMHDVHVHTYVLKKKLYVLLLTSFSMLYCQLLQHSQLVVLRPHHQLQSLHIVVLRHRLKVSDVGI